MNYQVNRAFCDRVSKTIRICYALLYPKSRHAILSTWGGLRDEPHFGACSRAKAKPIACEQALSLQVSRRRRARAASELSLYTYCRSSWLFIFINSFSHNQVYHHNKWIIPKTCLVSLSLVTLSCLRFLQISTQGINSTLFCFHL